MKPYLFGCFLSFVVAMPVAAQTDAPSTQQMIDQLKTPRTRGLRNLTVEAVPEPAPVQTQPGTASPTATPLPAVAPSTMATPSTPSTPSTPPMQPVVAVERPSLSLQIRFQLNSARVSPESQQALTRLAQALDSDELKGSRFAVEGHTDAKGTAEYNQRLSLQRAQAVLDFLAAQGVAADRLQAVGKGYTELANTEDPFAPENRRVRFVNLD